MLFALVEAAPKDFNWCVAGAELALRLDVPREAMTALAGVTDMNTFWEAAIKAIVHIESADGLAMTR